MPKIKTCRSAAKRFKTTGTGKIKRNKPFARHLMASKSPKRKRNLRKGTLVCPADAPSVKRAIPYS
jgi:large subunit ribosomal protein L35